MKNEKSKNLIMKTYSALVNRVSLMSRLGQHYDGDRDIYQALGYKRNPEYQDFATQYERQDIAKAVISRPSNATWRGGVTLVESDDAGETGLEKAWKELEARLKLTSKFNRLDKLTGLGEYGVLLLGFDDVITPNKWKEPVLVGERKLLYVKPLGEGSATISTENTNTSDPRYGLPQTYSISITNSGGVQTSLEVHHSRVIHVVEELMESETEGTPRLKPIFNRLKDLEKLTGGSAEMFWRGARPGYQGKVEPEYQMTPETKDDLKDQIDEYEHNLRRILTLEGVDFKALESQVADPTNHVDIQIQMISAATGIPKRILTGSEMGELASSQDRNNWLALLMDRRDNFAEPNIVRPFADKMIEYRVLPSPKESYSVKWVDLFSVSDKEKAEVGKIRATALKEYSAAVMQGSDFPELAFFKYFLGLKEDDIKMVEEMRLKEIAEEEETFEEEE